MSYVFIWVCILVAIVCTTAFDTGGTVTLADTIGDTVFVVVVIAITPSLPLPSSSSWS